MPSPALSSEPPSMEFLKYILHITGFSIEIQIALTRSIFELEIARSAMGALTHVTDTEAKVHIPPEG